MLKGTHFEQVSHLFLASLQMNLSRIGGPNDNGIDLIGRWKLIDESPLCVVQCKHVKCAVSSGELREFTGSIALCNAKPDLGILISSNSLSPQAFKVLVASQFPLLFMKLHMMDEKTQLEELFANQTFHTRFPQIVFSKRRSLNGFTEIILLQQKNGKLLEL